LVLNYPNSISVQLQFIPVSKRQSRGVHFASAPPPEAIISFLYTSPPRLFRSHHLALRLLLLTVALTGDDGCSRFKQIAMYNRFITTSVAASTCVQVATTFVTSRFNRRSHRTHDATRHVVFIDGSLLNNRRSDQQTHRSEIDETVGAMKGLKRNGLKAFSLA